MNGTLYFTADDAINGVELWKSNGTSAGTILVKDIFPGTGSSAPSELTNVNGTLFFSVNTGGPNGTELWKSDGTSAGTVNVSSSCYQPFNLTNVNGILYFGAYNITSGVELWKSDGTGPGTILVKDIFPGTGGSTFLGTYYLTNINDTVYFSAYNSSGANDFELWKSDGTNAGTVLVKDINPGTTGSYPSNLTNVNGTLYFLADDGSYGEELWKSDGTAAGTIMVKDIYAGSFGSFNTAVADLTNVNGTLYFSASDGINGYEPWKSDGQAAGTVMVKDISPGSGNSMSGLFPFYTAVNSTLYFNAYGTNGNELWKSDGTAAGTVLVRDIYPGNNSSYPSNLINMNGMLYFTADDGINGTELWKNDSSTVGISAVPAFANKIILYPNPNNGRFIIRVQSINDLAENVKIEICNLIGEQVYSTTFKKQQPSSEIDLSKFPKGIYFVKMAAGGETLTEKIVIQ